MPKLQRNSSGGFSTSASQERSGEIGGPKAEPELGDSQRRSQELESQAKGLTARKPSDAKARLTSEILIKKLVRGEQLPLDDLTKPDASRALSEG